MIDAGWDATEDQLTIDLQGRGSHRYPLTLEQQDRKLVGIDGWTLKGVVLLGADERCVNFQPEFACALRIVPKSLPSTKNDRKV